MLEHSRKIWQFPWGYPESVSVVCGILLTGVALQVLTGGFDFALLQWPANGWLGAGGLLLLALLALKRESAFYRWLSGAPLAVTLIGTLVVLGVVMGLGYLRMTASWPFILVYGLTLLALGALIIRRLASFRIRDYAFYLNHIGLWILLFAAGMGASDIKRYVMYVQEGQTEWRVFNDQHEALELPLAIELIDFRLEEYPPQLVLVNKHTGAVTPAPNQDQHPLADDDHFLTMTRPEPKRFVSDINVYAADGQQQHTLLEVNKPLRIGHWTVYQYGYDNEAGIYSTYSSFELVYDPWVPAVYAGILLLAAGSLCMLWSGNRRKEATDDLA